MKLLEIVNNQKWCEFLARADIGLNGLAMANTLDGSIAPAGIQGVRLPADRKQQIGGKPNMKKQTKYELIAEHVCEVLDKISEIYTVAAELTTKLADSYRGGKEEWILLRE